MVAVVQPALHVRPRFLYRVVVRRIRRQEQYPRLATRELSQGLLAVVACVVQDYRAVLAAGERGK